MKVVTKLIRVRTKDIKKMRKVCAELYCKEYPDKDMTQISDAELFESLVRFYITSAENETHIIA